MKPHRNRRRGALIYGMAAMILVFSTLCALVLLRSLESYRGAADLEQRLALRAAAEGAAVLAMKSGGSPTSATLELGACRVVFAESVADAPTTGTLTLPVTITRLAPNGAEIRRQEVRLHLARGSEGALTYAGMEVQP